MKATIRIAIILAFATCFISCNRMESEKTGTLVGTLFDEQGEATPARIYLTGANDSIYMAEKCLEYDRPWLARISGSGGRHFTSTGNQFTAHLPPGEYVIRCEKGKEYRPVILDVKVNPGTNDTLTIHFERWIHMKERGWYSADTHVHRELEDMDNLMHAEDLNLAFTLPYWNNMPETEDEISAAAEYFERADSSGVVTIDAEHMFSAMGHEIEWGEHGAILLMMTRKEGVPFEGIREFRRPMAYVDLVHRVHRAGGYAELEKPFWNEAHIQLALAGPDFTELANNHNCYHGYFPEIGMFREDLGPDYPEGEMGYSLFIFDLYYKYLNSGFNIMPTAGSASGVLPNPLGFNRVYTYTGGGLDYHQWLKALKAGHCFITNGPILTLEAGGGMMGDTIVQDREGGSSLPVTINLHSIHPVDKIELLRDGEIIQTISPVHLDGDSIRVETMILADESCWIVARCFEKREDANNRFAHTAPIFVEIDRQPFKLKARDIQWFIERTEILIEKALHAGVDPEGREGYINEEVREESLELYKSAKKELERRLKLSAEY